MLWRDAPLPELRTEPFSTAAVAQLEQLRLATLEERIDADLALGRDAALVTELESLVAEHAYRERLRAQLMLALYRSGRQVDALDAYQEGRRVLQDEFGLEPGKELRDLEAAILRQDEALSPDRPVPAAEPEQPPPTRRLSRRAVVAAGLGGLAAVSLGVGVTAVRSRGSSGTQVQPGSVGVVDPDARKVVAEIPVGFSSPLIAAGEGAVWLLDPRGSTLTRIDPETNDAVRRRGIHADGVPMALAVGEGSVWIALDEGAFSACSRSGRSSTTCGDGSSWNGERGVPRVDRIQAHGRRGRRLASGGHSGRSPGSTRQRATPSCSRRASEPRRRSQSTGMPSGSEALRGDEADCAPGWSSVTRSWKGCSRRRPPRSHSAVTPCGSSATRAQPLAHRSPERVDPGLLPDGASPSAVAVAEDGAVWVASGSATSLWRLDPKTNDDETFPLGAISGGLVAEFGSIWTSPGAPAGSFRRFRFSNGWSSIGQWAADSGSRSWAWAGVSPCSFRPLLPVRTANRGTTARFGSCGATSPTPDPALANGRIGSWVLLNATCAKLFTTVRDPDTRARVVPEVVRSLTPSRTAAARTPSS